MTAALNLLGKNFGRLVVLKRYGTVLIGKNTKRAAWMCLCKCGNKTKLTTQALVTKNTLSCGCLDKENRAKRTIKRNKQNAKHNKCRERVYSIWECMKARCLNPKNTGYYLYGARGIDVCKRWIRFENFYADMGDPPSKIHSIDRIDNYKGYSGANCQWATPKEQANNRRKREIK